MKQMDISKLIPSESFFELKQMKGVKLKLKPATALTIMNMEKSIGSIEKILKNPSAVNISKAALFLMDIESAKNFIKQEVEFMNVLTGEVETKEVGGYELLMECISGFDEQFNMLRAIMVSFGFNDEEAKAMIADMRDGVNKVINKSVNSKKKQTKKAS